MQTHVELGLVTWDPEKKCYNEDALALEFMQGILFWSISKLKESLNEVQEYISKLGTVQKIRTIMNTVRPYYMLKEKIQAVKQPKLNVLCKKLVQNNSSKTSYGPVPTT